MKKFCFITLMMAVSLRASAVASWPTSFNPYSDCMVSTSYNLTKVTDDDGWILIGEKIMTATVWNDDSSIHVNLYVREIAQRLIYRVEYGGKYYALKSERTSSGVIRYSTCINGKDYYFNDEK